MTNSVRWIMTTAPSQFDLKPLALDKGAGYTFEGEPLRKVIIDALQADKQMAMYASERTDDGEPVYFSMLDKEFADQMVNNVQFAQMVKPIIGDTDIMAPRKHTTTRTTTKPQAPATPVAPQAPAVQLINGKPVVKALSHLEQAKQLAAERKAKLDQEKAAATQKLLADKAAQAPAQTPQAPARPLIMTPNTPAERAPVTDEQAQKREQALARLVKVESEVKEITAFLTKEKLASRIGELEKIAMAHTTGVEKICDTIASEHTHALTLAAMVTSQQSTIDTLLGALSDMATRMVDLENAVATYLVSGAPVADMAPAKPLDVFDVLGYAYETVIETPVQAPQWGSELDAPAAVQAPVRNGKVPQSTPPAPARTIPARGTGAMARYAHLVPEIKNMVDAGFSQKDIAVHFNICGEDGKPSGKVVWHLIDKSKN